MQSPKTSKPLLSFWQLWNMSFGYVGIQFGFALQNANVSRIFETLGARVDDIAVLWVAAPVSGLLLQPIVGHLSDKTWNRLGRRKPYFLIGALLASLSLLVMPNSPGIWFAAGMLWIMDGSINITMQPFRAFIGDMLPDEQRTTGFAVQTFFIGVSSVVASSLPYILTRWLHIANTAPDGGIPQSVRLSFYAGGLVYLVAVLYTIFSVKEYSPQELEGFSASGADAADAAGEGIVLNLRRYTTEGVTLTIAGLVLAYVISVRHWDKSLHILAFGLAAYGVCQLLAAYRHSRGKNGGLVEIIHDLKNMPRTMTQLALVTMLTWFGLFAMFIYSTSAITSHHFGTNDPHSALYNEGANWVGILMSVYNGVAAVVAPFLPFLARRLGRVRLHVACLVIGGLGLISMYGFKDPNWLLLSMTAIGIAWASLLTIPYAILSSAVPQRKMGVYMGIFNLFVVIPQILASASLGVLVRSVFHGQTILTLVLGGAAMLLAGAAMLLVRDNVETGGPAKAIQ